MMGKDMVSETSVIFNQPIRQVARDDLITFNRRKNFRSYIRPLDPLFRHELKFFSWVVPIYRMNRDVKQIYTDNIFIEIQILILKKLVNLKNCYENMNKNHIIFIEIMIITTNYKHHGGKNQKPQ
jgi:hypothetical protein